MASLSLEGHARVHRGSNTVAGRDPSHKQLGHQLASRMGAARHGHAMKLVNSCAQDVVEEDADRATGRIINRCPNEVAAPPQPREVTIGF
jgi:hypothetical protein